MVYSCHKAKKKKKKFPYAKDIYMLKNICPNCCSRQLTWYWIHASSNPLGLLRTRLLQLASIDMQFSYLYVPSRTFAGRIQIGFIPFHRRPPSSL